MEKHASKRDINEDAADVVRRSTAAQDAVPEGLEAAWADWSRRIQAVDTRTMTLLRAAFEAGAEVGPKLRSAKGGIKGGKVRAAKLSAKALSKIGRQGAEARWGKKPKPRKLK